MKYIDVLNQLKTGDIVLFSGKGGISTGIKWVTFSQYSHVGMVVNLPEYSVVTLMESTTLSKVKDIESGQYIKGVQIVPLNERVGSYDGKITVRQLEGVSLDQSALRGLISFRNEVKGRAYETNKIELLKSAFDGYFGHNDENLSSLFCSELVAEAYQRLGLISDDLPSNEFTPKDFSVKGGLKLLKGKLGKEIPIK